MFWILKHPPADPVYKPLMGSPIPIFLILSFYLIFVLKIGKNFMKNRSPYNIKNILLVYNIIQVIYNTILFILSFYFIFISPLYKLECMETLPLDHQQKVWERNISYAYMLNKVLDLFDTIFIVLRKNWKQITLLHLYHHAGMVFGGYILVRTYGYGGHVAITGILNSFIHILMYMYYFLSAYSDQMKSSLWWKKYITKLQLVQFLIIFLHTVYVMVFSKDCNYPRTWLLVHLTQSVVMMIMFGNFYVNAYVTSKKPKNC